MQEKKPGDLVTEADREAEVLITAGLHRLDPGAVVVGEEAVAADPGVADLVRTADRVWLVDPVDGAGSKDAGADVPADQPGEDTDGATVFAAESGNVVASGPGEDAGLPVTALAGVALLCATSLVVVRRRQVVQARQRVRSRATPVRQVPIRRRP